MLSLVALVIFVLSAGGLLLILAKKIPVLVTLPQQSRNAAKFDKEQIVVNAEGKVRQVISSFKKQILLRRILTWAKVVILKAEVEIDKILHHLRKEAQQTTKK